jgi:hypothetical protein
MDNSRTFQLDQAQVANFQNKLNIRWTPEGDWMKAKVEVSGVVIGLLYDPPARNVSVTIVRKPFYVSHDRVWNEIENYLQKGDSA